MTFTYLEVGCAVAVQVGLIYSCFKYEDITYRTTKKFFLKWWFLVAVALGMATVLHPGKKGKFFFTLQMFVSFTMFLEAIALIP